MRRRILLHVVTKPVVVVDDGEATPDAYLTETGGFELAAEDADILIQE